MRPATAAALPSLTLHLTGKSIQVGGSMVSGAVNVVSTTTGRDASPTLVRLNPGVTVEQAMKVAGSSPDPNTVSRVGAIVFDADAPHGTSTVQTVLQAGNYIALDTSGGNPSRFPTATFTVTPSSSPAALPKATATVRAIDFGFRGARTLHDGQLVRFENTGYVVHMITALRVKDAAAARKLTAVLKAGKDNLARKLVTGFAGFLGPASTGALQQQVLHAAPGVYVLVCFMDTQDGREHARLGMERTIRIVK